MKRLTILVASLTVSVVLAAQTKTDAVLFLGVELDESYLLSESPSVVFDGEGGLNIYLGDVKKGELVIGEGNPPSAEFRNAFSISAKQDPDHEENYHSTFYTSEGAYKVPADGSVKAYIGSVGKHGEADVLKLTATDTIHAGEAVILRAGQSDITLMPSCNTHGASKDNVLTGTDTEKYLGANQYALSKGTYGVGFYLWEGKKIGANKAYLDLGGSQSAPLRSFGFMFDDGTVTGIPATTWDYPHDDAIYNLQGQKVDENYKGVVIKNGQKMFNR